MLNFNEFINESIKRGYWVFEPKEGFNKQRRIRYSYPRYSKEDAIEHFLKNTQNASEFKEPFLEEEKESTISFNDDSDDSEFVKWLRKFKGFDRPTDELTWEYSATELDYLYQEFTENN